MAKEKKEATQISWSELNGNVIATMPVTNNQLTFNPKDLHESWKDFIINYGIKQYCSSNISGLSFPAKERLESVLKEFPELTREQAIEVVKSEKPAWLRANGSTLQKGLWDEFQALKVQKVKKESVGRATKADIEAAAIKAENDRLIALATENAKKLNIPVEIAMQLMGVKPIEAAPVDGVEETETDERETSNIDEDWRNE